MASIEAEDQSSGVAICTYHLIFSTLTAKQHDVFALLADGRTTKEVAWRLGVTESAILQRIEAVRSRAGSVPRAELARDYRLYLASEPGANSSPVASAVLATATGKAPISSVDRHRIEMAFADNEDYEGGVAWSQRPAGLIVPDGFAGPNAGLNRMAAMVVIAVGLLAAAMIGLGVAQALANLM